MTTLESIDFKSLIAKETNGRMRVRLMALSHIKEGANNTQAARNLHISRRIVNDWVKRFYEQGLDGLKEKALGGKRNTAKSGQATAVRICLLVRCSMPSDW